MGCVTYQHPVKIHTCYCNVNVAILITENRTTPDLCNDSDKRIPCDMRPYINGTFFDEPFLVHNKGKYYII